MFSVIQFYTQVPINIFTIYENIYVNNNSKLRVFQMCNPNTPWGHGAKELSCNL